MRFLLIIDKNILSKSNILNDSLMSVAGLSPPSSSFEDSENEAGDTRGTILNNDKK